MKGMIAPLNEFFSTFLSNQKGPLKFLFPEAASGTQFKGAAVYPEGRT